MGNRVGLLTYKYIINENNMGLEDSNVHNNFNFHDWKSFYGEQRLKNLVSDFSTESSSTLPLIYFIKYYLGFPDDSKMERIRSTKWIFRR